MELGRFPPGRVILSIYPLRIDGTTFSIKIWVFSTDNDGNMKYRMIYMIIDIQIKS